MTAHNTLTRPTPLLGTRYLDDGVALLYLDKTQRRVKQQLEHKVRTGVYDFVAVACALCDGSHFDSLAHKDRCGLRTPVVVCTDCGLVQTNPRMSADAYRTYYQTEYQILQYDKSLPEDAFVRERTRGNNLVEYLEGSGLWPTSAAPFVVDVGCGAGGVLSVFADRGWRVLGVDVAVERLQLAKARFGLELVDGSLADLSLNGSCPELVIYSHSLEHVLDPNRELETLRASLGANSLVYVEVPGIKKLDPYQDDFLRYLQNAHVYHFSLETLTRLMEKHGFIRIAGDENVRAVFKLTDRTARVPIRSDYLSVITALQEAETRARRVHVVSAARSLLVRMRLLSVARNARRTARRLRFFVTARARRSPVAKVRSETSGKR